MSAREFTCGVAGQRGDAHVQSAVLRVPDLLTQLSRQARVRQSRVQQARVGQARVRQRSAGGLLLVLALMSLSGVAGPWTGLGAGAGAQLSAEGPKSLLPQVQLWRDAQVV